MKQPERVGLTYVINSLNPGGTERLAVEMSCALAADYNVDVVCLDSPGLWAGALRSRGIPVHSLWRQPGLDLSMSVKLGQHFRQRDTRIVHAHQCTPWFYCALSRLWNPKPRLLVEEHGRLYPEAENRTRALVNRMLICRLTHRYVAVSRDLRKRLQRYEGIEADQIEVIYNGVSDAEDLDRSARNALRSEFGFGERDFVVGTVGRCDPIKNLPMLVASLASATKQAESVRGLIIGDGPTFGEVHNAVENAGLSQRVRLTGYRTDARKLTQCLDLFVLASFSEGTSMALLEAMAAGVAAAVTDVGGNAEIVLDHESGWTVPSGSVESLTAVIVEAATDARKRREFALAGRQRFQEHFSMTSMLNAYRQRYSELLASTR
jgi:glycosyltransferase involved in cell wall biosynthesis